MVAATPILTADGPLDNIDSEFIEAIEDRIPHAKKWTDESLAEFINELSDLGITTADLFDDHFYGVVDDSFRVEKDFTEEYFTSIYSTSNEIFEAIYFAIDWQRAWDHSLSYDFNYFVHDGDAYFFHNF